MTLLGIDYYGVPAYVNDFIEKHHYVKNIYTGIQWECVEYVRRWYILVFNLTFSPIQNAIDIWNIPYVYIPNTKQKFGFDSVINGSNVEPRVGDILVFKKNEFYPYGHVGIITRITSDYVYLAEQNIDTIIWNKPYSRKIKRRVDTVLDPFLLGWKTLRNF
jgi:glutathionylspermidine amidase/synthetase